MKDQEKSKEILLKEVKELRNQILKLHKIEDKNKEIKESLRLQKVFSENLFENSALSIWIANEEGTAIKANSACLRFFGATSEEIIGKYNIFKDEELIQQGFIPEIKQVFENGKVIDVIIDYNFSKVEHVNVKNPTHKIIHSTFAPIRDENNKIINVICQTMDITEIKKSEEILRDNEARYHMLFEAAGDAIFLMRDNKFVDCNLKTLEMFECNRDDIIGYQPAEFSPPKQLDGSLSSIKAKKKIDAALKGDPQFFEWQHKKLNGETFDAEVSLNLLKLHNKKYIQAIVRDVTERKRIQLELRENLKLLSAVLGRSPIGISVRDKHGTLILNNKSWQKIWGLSDKDIADKMRPRDHLRFNEKDDYLGIHKAKIEELYKKGGQYSIPEIKLKTGNKEKAAWISQQFYTINEEKSEVEKVVILSTDITESKMSKERLKKSEDRHKKLIETAAEGFWLINSKNKTINVNKSLCKIIGYSKEEIMGKTPYDFCDKKNGEILKKQMNRSKSIKQKTYELELIKKSGEKISTLFNATVMLNKLGRRTGAFAFVTDITKQKNAEKKIKRNLQEKDTLLRELYHRTKNSMQIISSMLRMQSRSIENHSLSDVNNVEFVLSTFKAVNNKIKAMSLVHQKLYQAKDLSHINLKEYVNDLIQLLMISYGFRSDAISLKVSIEEIFVLIDTAIPLGLILNELISNIFKHAFIEGEKNEICIKLHKPDEDTISIFLSDNGVGIPADIDLEKVNTIGLQTIFSLIKYQLKGDVSYTVDNGLKWQIIIEDNIHSERI